MAADAATLPAPTAQPNPVQLVQEKVPLDAAADAFATRDASGRIPIVLVPAHPNRIRNDFLLAAVVVVVAGILAQFLFVAGWLVPSVLPVALVLVVLALWRSFYVRVPEGASGLLGQGGKYLRTIGSGSHIVPPWIIVSHLVTRREIPFDAPIVAAQTKDNVRAGVDTLLTFTITDPYRFVFSISTDDFDQVLQASCQEALRGLIRRVTADEVIDLARAQAADLMEAIGSDVAHYGVQVMAIKITSARPPDEFVRSQEQRQLAVVQRSEQAEAQVLAQRRQTDSDALAQQELLARIARDRDALQIRVQQAEAQRRVVSLEAEAEELRLARLEERLRTFPLAAQYDWESQRLEVARALAGNTRAVLQVGNADDIAQALLIRETLQGADALRESAAVGSATSGANDHSRAAAPAPVMSDAGGERAGVNGQA